MLVITPLLTFHQLESFFRQWQKECQQCKSMNLSYILSLEVLVSLTVPVVLEVYKHYTVYQGWK